MKQSASLLKRATLIAQAAVIPLLIVLSLGCSEEEKVNPVTTNEPAADTIQMVLIPAGTFRMGNITDNPVGHPWEKPVHNVTITHAFLMSRTEITQGQYHAVTGHYQGEFISVNHPISAVTWYEAVTFCNALSVLEGLDTCYTGSGESTACDFTASGYRLPTEAEWEYACRGGTETDFCTGTMTDTECADPALDRAGWYCGNSSAAIQRVGLKEPNSFGLCDMYGNMQEWCWDRFAEYPSNDATDPHGPETGAARILRGGCYFWKAGSCRSASRSPEPSLSISIGNCGLRIVRTQ